MRALPVLLVLAAVAPVPAAAQTRPEAQARVAREFAAADRNRDGALDRGEVTHRVVQVFGGRRGLTPAQSRILTNHYFQRLDLNRDNRVSRDEAKLAANNAFTRFDRNRNGRLDPPERGAMVDFLRNPAH